MGESGPGGVAQTTNPAAATEGAGSGGQKFSGAFRAASGYWPEDLHRGNDNFSPEDDFDVFAKVSPCSGLGAS